jgi:hypothetical protein
VEALAKAHEDCRVFVEQSTPAKIRLPFIRAIGGERECSPLLEGKSGLRGWARHIRSTRGESRGF